MDLEDIKFEIKYFFNKKSTKIFIISLIVFIILLGFFNLIGSDFNFLFILGILYFSVYFTFLIFNK